MLSYRRLAAVLLLCGVFAGTGQGQGTNDPLLRKLETRAESIRPPACDCRWQQIPWVIDLQLALRQAQEEKRPICFWAAGGRERDGVPLERC